MTTEGNLATSRGRLLAAALRIVGAARLAALAGAISFFAAFMTGSFIPFALGTSALVLVVVARCASRRVWIEAANEEASRAIELPGRADVFDGTARTFLNRIEVARMQLDQVLAAGGGRQRRDGRDDLVGMRNVRELERAAVAALLKLEYLAGAPPKGADAAAEPREDQPAQWPPAAAPLLQRASAAKAERARSLQGLEVHRREALARLEYLTACLEAVPAELMELRVLKAQAIERSMPDPVRDADLLREDVQQMRQELAG